MPFPKKIFYLFFLILTGSNRLHAQQIYLKVNGKSPQETAYLKQNINDSIFGNGQDLEKELHSLQNTLKSNGYFYQKMTSTEKKDSLYLVQFDLGKKTDSLKINFNQHQAKLQTLLYIDRTSVTIPIQTTEGYLKNLVEKLAQKGYSISTAKLTNHQFVNELLIADLDLHIDE